MLPREDAELLLRNDGDFLVRLTEPRGKEKKFAISAQWNRKKKHFVLKQTPEGLYYVDKQGFNTVQDLINFHLTSKSALTEQSGYRILTPIFKQDWELRHDQITLGKKLGEGKL